MAGAVVLFFFFSSRRRHTRFKCDWSSDVCSSDLCPFIHTAAGATVNADWWPNQLNLKILHKNSPLSDPMDKEFNYAEEFKSLDLDAVIKDLHPLLTDSQDCVPATFDIYAPRSLRLPGQ